MAIDLRMYGNVLTDNSKTPQEFIVVLDRDRVVDINWGTRLPFIEQCSSFT